MNARIGRRALLAGLGASLARPAFAQQGFAGLGAAGDAGFAAVTPGRTLVFPDDLGPHPAFRTEWWYVTANLRGADGAEYGAQWTLFRQGLQPGTGEGWADPSVWMGHAAVTSASEHRFAERLARGGVGQAGAQGDPFQAWIDDWALGLTQQRPADWLMSAAGEDFAYRLWLSNTGPFVAQGDQGYSVKSERGQASYYFSAPFLEAAGTVDFGAGPVEVTGDAWLDREWSTQPLAADQEGWDWFSLRLEGGERVMAFRLRGAASDYLSGTWISPDGEPFPLGGGEIVLTPGRTRRVAGRRLPVRWRLEIPVRGIDLALTPLNPDAWVGASIPYWEGPVAGEGSHNASGYLEMTGY